jgi:hypothetical protein
MSRLKQHVPVLLAVLATASLTLGGPAIAHGVRHALFAHNADKVDGIHASKSPRANRLVPLNRNKRFPASTVRTSGSIAIAALTFNDIPYSEHNSSFSQTLCGTHVVTALGGEDVGERENSTGSFYAPVHLPQGARVTRVDLIVNDPDAADVHAFLSRRESNVGGSIFSGYSTMAQASSSGASDPGIVSRFSDSTINTAVIDNSRYMYYVELVDCGGASPHGVRIHYS